MEKRGATRPCDRALDALPEKPSSPSYSAPTPTSPTVVVERMHLPLPFASRSTQKLPLDVFTRTRPVGMPASASEDTANATVNGSPTADGSGVTDVMVVVVGSSAQ